MQVWAKVQERQAALRAEAAEAERQVVAEAPQLEDAVELGVGLRVHVKTLGGKLVSMSVDPADTVASIKARLGSIESVPAAKLVLCLPVGAELEPLDESRSLQECDFGDRAVLFA